MWLIVINRLSALVNANMNNNCKRLYLMFGNVDLLYIFTLLFMFIGTLLSTNIILLLLYKC